MAKALPLSIVCGFFHGFFAFLLTGALAFFPWPEHYFPWVLVVSITVIGIMYTQWMLSEYEDEISILSRSKMSRYGAAIWMSVLMLLASLIPLIILLFDVGEREFVFSNVQDKIPYAVLLAWTCHYYTEIYSLLIKQ